MDKYVIKGGNRLTGSVTISGAKNAAVAILPAVVLCDEPCVIENVPNISDVSIIIRILYEMGAEVKWLTKSSLRIDCKGIKNPVVPYEMARLMRGSYYFLGSLLGKFHRAKVAMPGGCDLGSRPIDQHLKCFRALGARDEIDGGVVCLEADELIGSQVYFDMISVGATVNAILSSVKAKGLTIIENAAKEPHIVDLANFLNTMGANIMGAGTDVIKVRGVDYLKGVNYSIIPDQIEAGTYMVAIAATKGDAIVENVIPKHLESITTNLQKIGVNVEEYDDSVRVWVDSPLKNAEIKTMPHPGFPTDMQPQITALLTLAKGTSIIRESIWENRFRYVGELLRMNADISVDGKVAIVQGTGMLKGAPVRATDLRAGAALVIAALAAEGTSEIEDVFYIERGYENIVEKLTKLGADITVKPIPGNSIKKVV
ncbi:MAG: UDP-N-acetylglucosamine 1-carboxyvinyltransferase [Oscillospiraceae bacterium]